jgi:hypothetical protein
VGSGDKERDKEMVREVETEGDLVPVSVTESVSDSEGVGERESVAVSENV